MPVQQVDQGELRHLPLGDLELPQAKTLDVWLIDIDTAKLSPIDSGDTNNRSEKIKQRRFAQQFYTRLLLAAYLNIPPAKLQISRSVHGKPLLEPLDQPPLHFNISHSRNWLAIAISTEQMLGVDIECDRTNNDPLALAKRYFSESEILWLQTSDDLQSAFNQLWVRKEAALKCLGLGIAGKLAKTHCSLIESAASDQVDLQQLPTGCTGINKLEIINWQNDESGIFAAIALENRPKSINSFQLSCTRS